MTIFCLFLSLMVVEACSSSKKASSSSKTNSTDKVENVNPAVDLVDYLSRISGISVTGRGSSARVSIRGMASINSDSEPLLVINGTPISGGLAAANSTVLVSDIKSIRVLKSPSETAFYGSRGSNGVIVIKLKQ
ncbi:MAG: TonB-dependent receptor plug domain-containing protein [Saprospiraceae bacterium]